MASTLNTVIRQIFYANDINSQIRRQYYGRSNFDTSIISKKYMEIPINSNIFELPLLAFNGFVEMHKNRKECDVIVALLYSGDRISTYKSLDSIMKDVLSTPFDYHLCKVQIPNSPNVYYATFGAIFDENFTPLMMLSWIMERKTNAEGVVKYHYKKPLLRLNPYPCLYKEDALQKFICGRWMTTALGTTVYNSYHYDCRGFIEDVCLDNHMKVEIDECPFTIRGIDIPSVSVTNKGLLQLAADYVDDILP